MTEPPFEPVDEDWSRGLAVVAHPDDLEYGAAAAIARWTSQGKELRYCLATRGEAGIDGMSPDEAGPLREAEQRASARIVGVTDVEFLDHQDGVLEYGLTLRRDITAAIRRHRPETVITGNYHETFGGGVLNQADHVALGRATVDAVRDAGNRWVFHDQVDAGLQPWSGVRAVLVAGSPGSGHAVDVDDHLTAGIASLEAHAAYLTGLGDGRPDPAEFLESFARAAGTRLGCRFAVPFEVLRLTW